jgi:uncharacterized protein YpmB
MINQILIILGFLVAIGVIVLMFNRSVKNYEAQKSKMKKKKGRNKYMPEVKNFKR